VFNNNLIDNSIDFLFDNSFSFGFNNLFSGGGGGGVKKLNYNNKANFNIDRDFKSILIKASYKIDVFLLKNNEANFNIDRDFNDKNNFTFYKLGIIQTPPKRLTNYI